jgi:hypothetical protein
MTRRVGRSALFAVTVVLAAAAGARMLEAQGARSDALRRQIEQRFEVLPLQNGVALRPRGSSTIQSIELSGDTIAVDGAPVTGAELGSASAPTTPISCCACRT